MNDARATAGPVHRCRCGSGSCTRPAIVQGFRVGRIRREAYPFIEFLSNDTAPLPMIRRIAATEFKMMVCDFYRETRPG
jgi:hypothetical protein